MTNDTLALSFTDPPVTDDRVNGPEEPEKKSCPLTLSPRDGTHGAQALTVSEARDEHEQPPGFNYAEVPEIGDQLRETAARVRKRMGVYLIETGRDLLCWRDRLKRGQFHRWIEEECGLTVRVAQLTMNVAEYADLLGERERENFSRMPAAVQYQLAAPSVPDSVREQVLEASASGRPFKVAEVKEMVRAAKPKMEPQAASLEVDSGSNSNTKNEDKPEKRAEAVSAKEDVISSVLETHRVSSQAASESSKAPEIQRPARAILQSKLDATTDDARRQAIIKDIFVLVNKMSTSERVTLISNLNKLADITSKQLAECLQ